MSDATPVDRIPFALPHREGTAEASAQAFYERMQSRRSVRMFSDAPVARETIEWCIKAAGTAPSGAHKQPWRFVAISNADLKHAVREAAEIEERAFYERRAGEAWLKDLEPFETTSDKAFLDVVPWVIVVFKMMKTDDGGQVYYANESVGIAVGMLLSALHHAGLSTLTHTPSPLKFLSEVLDRPAHERAYMVIPVGYPADDCVVPDIQRKPLDEIMVTRE